LISSAAITTEELARLAARYAEVYAVCHYPQDGGHLHGSYLKKYAFSHRRQYGGKNALIGEVPLCVLRVRQGRGVFPGALAMVGQA
jgi:hypothetical protein